MFEQDDQSRIFGVTAVENLFFTEYLPSAEGDAVKVYLCGLFHSQLHDDGYGIKEMAKELSLDEIKIESALRYWERRRLVSRLKDNPPTYRFHHLGQRLLTGQDDWKGDNAYIAFSEAVYALFGDRRKIRPGEVATAYEWVQELGLPQGVVLMLLSHCIATRGIGFTFKYAEKLATVLREEGIAAEEDAEKYFNHDKLTRDGTKAVLRRFGLRRSPTEDELDLYRKWVGEWDFSHDDIQNACQETVKASNPSFAYLNGILEGLRRRGTKGAPVREQLEKETELMTLTRETLNALGVRINPVAVQNAYIALLDQYPHGMILLAAEAVGRKGGKFEDLPIALQAWYARGIDDESKARAYLDKLSAQLPLIKRIMDACGQEGSPGDKDRAFIDDWLAVFAPDLILHAAAQARSARQKFFYIDRVLKTWKEKGIQTVEEAMKEQPVSASQRPSREVGAHRYDQRQYTEEQLERNTHDLIKEALEKRES